jgi:hypothetical protein
MDLVQQALKISGLLEDVHVRHALHSFGTLGDYMGFLHSLTMKLSTAKKVCGYAWSVNKCPILHLGCSGRVDGQSTYEATDVATEGRAHSDCVTVAIACTPHSNHP